jgi:hypothetical protein
MIPERKYASGIALRTALEERLKRVDGGTLPSLYSFAAVECRSMVNSQSLGLFLTWKRVLVT